MSRILRLKISGLVVAALPIAGFTLFAMGEAGAEEGWWSHLAQVAAVAVLLLVAWRWPRLGGTILILAGLAFSALILAEAGESTQTRVLTAGVFFAPVAVSGVLFAIAGQCAASERRSGPK